jgi:transcriptional regulator of heat shock response
MISERQKFILDKIIQDYIELAEPISSEFLCQKHFLNIKPATIRREFQFLTKEGFLYQPHISAGRVPTDKAYKFFVESVLKEKKPRTLKIKRIIKELKRLKDYQRNILSFFKELSDFLAKVSSNLALIRFREPAISIKSGWSRIIKEPEFEDPNFVRDLMILADSFEEETIKFFEEAPIFQLKIYIGKESPLPRSQNFSLILTRGEFLKKECLISLVGPKRMRYLDNICLMKALLEILNKN